METVASDALGDPATAPVPATAPEAQPPETSWIGAWVAIGRIIVGVVVAHAVVVLFPQSVQHTKLGTLSSGTWFGTFDRWDASYYTAIAARGYPSHPAYVRAFFPGYPVVIRVVHVMSGGLLGYSQTGSVVSFAAFIAAALLLHRLVARRFGSRAAMVAVLLFCWCPTSCFFLAPYTEALFALEILLVATLLDRGRWWPAALVAGYATATSPEAAAITLAIVVAALIARRGTARIVGYAVAGGWGAAAYMIFLGIRFGDPLAFAAVLSHWQRVEGFPFVGVVRNVSSIHRVLGQAGPLGTESNVIAHNVALVWLLDDFMMVVAGCALVYLVVIALRARSATGALDTRSPLAAASAPDSRSPVGGRVPMTWIVVLGGIVAIASTTTIRFAGTFTSTEADARLVSVAFPLYPALYLMLRRWPGTIILLITSTIAAALLFQVMFNLGYWMT